jgi:hypothetical protein
MQSSPFAHLVRGKAANPFAGLSRKPPASVEPAAPPANDAAAVARQIIAAGEKRRGEIVAAPQTASSPAPKIRAPINTTGHIVAPADTSEFENVVAAPEALARKIIEAATLAREGGPQMPEPRGKAAEIIAAGETRRKLGKA